MKKTNEEWYGGPYDGTKNPPDCADGMVKCVATNQNLFIFEVFDQHHFYKLTRQVNRKRKKYRWLWSHCGVCPPEQWDKWIEEWGGEQDFLINEDDYDHISGEEEDEQDQ